MKYGLAVLAVILAAMATWFIPVIGERAVFLIFLFMILHTALWLGLKPGLLAIALSLAAVNTLFWVPGQFPPHDILILNAGFCIFASLMTSSASFYRRSAAALRESREDLNRAQAVARTGSWRMNVERNELRWSDETYRIFGIPMGTSLSYETFLALVHPEDREYVDRRWQAALRGEPYDIEHRIVVEGEVKWVRERAELEFDPEGRLLGGFGTAQDITALKRAEKALREADRRKDEFLAMLAHELRNPLAPIRNAVHILKRDGLKESQIAWCHDVIDRQVGHLAHLVDDLLDISRITRGRIELRKEPLDLVDIVERAVETSQPLIDARRHELSVHLSPEPLRVEGDPVRLAQVVANLLNNAAKYTDEGGHIRLAVEPEDGDVLIRVRDNGRGIDPSALSSLFDLFYQVDRTIDRAEGGLGIGLSLVKSLVAMHGGRVQAFSGGYGTGSEFVVRLPRLPDPPQAVGATESAV